MVCRSLLKYFFPIYLSYKNLYATQLHIVATGTYTPSCLLLILILVPLCSSAEEPCHLSPALLTDKMNIVRNVPIQ